MAGVTRKGRGINGLVDALQKMAAKKVLVGFPRATTEREAAGNVPSQVTNAALGYIHEHGAPEAGIPARPFLASGVKNAQERIVQKMGQAAKAVLQEDTGEVDRRLVEVGSIAQSAVRNKITEGPFEPLAESTLAARRRRGVTRTKPLIDTGQLRQAVNFAVRED